MMTPQVSRERLGRFVLPMVAVVALGIATAPVAQATIIHQWTFNEGSGTNAADSVGSVDGTIFGGAAHVATPADAGNGNWGISADGFDDVINFGQPASLDFTTQAFTIEAWVAINTTAQTGNFHGIFGKSSSSWQLQYEHNNATSRRHRVTVNTDNGQSVAAGPVGSADPSLEFLHILAT